MIVKMKKIHVIIHRQDQPGALDALRGLGTVHVEPLRNYPEMDHLNLNIEEKRIEQVLTILKSYDIAEAHQESFGNFKPVSDDILSAAEEIERLKKSVEDRAVRLKNWEPWGDFDPEDIRNLTQNGVFIHLYEFSKSQKVELPQGAIMETISESGGVRRCMVILQENISLPYERVYLPMISMHKKRELQEKEWAQIKELEAKIQSYGKYREALEEALMHIQEEVKFKEVSLGMENHEEVMVLKGFIPEDQSEKLQSAAASNSWGLSIEDVSPEDDVPTLLKNPKPVELSKPAFQVIEIIPGYKEFDVSAIFLVFFTLFFAMLIGDAAYGAIFFLGTLIAHVTMGRKLADKKPFYLMYLLTGATMIWGVLTGTYFGQQWLPSTVKAVVPWLNDTTNIQWLCFTIALVHLGLARLWAAAAQIPKITALAEMGWFLIVCGMYFLAKQFVLNQPMPGFTMWLFVAGISLAFFFMFPPKQWIKNIGQQIIPFGLSVISAGTDIISYIRLFAVGLATVAVADAANSMPEALPGGLGYGFMIFLHFLNLILAAMAILVHAIRLNVLEFSGHLGLEWGGFKYNPFKKITEQQT